MSEILPLFKSHYSLGKSILTLEKPRDKGSKLSCPDSVFEILEENGMSKFILVDDNPSGYLQASVNAKKLKKELYFGIRFTYVENAAIKDDANREAESRIVIFLKNKNGYKQLIKIWSEAANKGFYYYPRVDDSILASVDTSDLALLVPFYDSYLYRNNFECKFCTPGFFKYFKSFSFGLEDNELPFDETLRSLVKKAANDFSAETVETKSIFYKNREDFLTYLTFRCIDKRATLSKPNLDHMCSEEFCFEAWKEKNNGIRF
jgi:DNA polymerase-3 subunit alpha